MSVLPIVLACAAACLAGCAASRARASEPTAPARFQPAGNEAFVACNERVDCGTRVVLWTEEPRYSAYASEPRFRAKADAAPLEPCYRAGRWRKVELAEGAVENGAAAESAEPEDEALVAPWSGDLDALRGTVDQLVLHYDAAGFSRTCFDVLHDRRGLSAHFLLDLDGTLYQTLDLRETAWHATRSNPRSIGIEIANIGAYRPGATALDKSYVSDAEGPIARVPADGGGLLRAGFVARPARPERVRGVVQGAEYEQHDFTPEQYESLARLTAALCHTFPALRPDAPRGADGAVLARVLDGEEWRGFQGILGHLHVQANKIDPGPAFDWERFLARVRERMAERAALTTAAQP